MSDPKPPKELAKTGAPAMGAAEPSESRDQTRIDIQPPNTNQDHAIMEGLTAVTEPARKAAPSSLEEEDTAVDLVPPAFERHQSAGQTEDSNIPPDADDLASPKASPRNTAEIGQEFISSMEGAAELEEEPPQQLEGSYSRQTTDFYQARPGTDAQKKPVAQLIGISGKDAGKEYAVRGAKTTIGRGTNNSICCHEPSMSRSHASLHYDGSTFTLVDHDSGNGTFVNENKITESRIKSTDTLRFGNGTFRFLETGDVFKPLSTRGDLLIPETAPPQQAATLPRPFALALALGLGVLACILVLAGGLRQRSTHTESLRDLQLATEAAGRRAWAEAEKHSRILQKQHANHPEIASYLRLIEAEKKHKENLERARVLASQEDWAQSLHTLSLVVDSVYETEALQIQDSIYQKIRQELVRSQTLLSAGQREFAEEFLGKIEGKNFDHAAIRSLRNRLSGSPHAAPAPAGTPQ